MEVKPIKVEMKFIVGAITRFNKNGLEKIVNMSWLDLEYMSVDYRWTRVVGGSLTVELGWNDNEEVVHVEQQLTLLPDSVRHLSIRQESVWVSLETSRCGDYYTLIFSNTDPELQSAA